MAALITLGCVSTVLYTWPVAIQPVGRDFVEGQHWLSEHDEERAVEMKEHVTAFWGDKADMLTYTPHDPGHFARVERNMQRVIPRDKWSLLSDSERMVLTWCAWTHDVGMHKECYSDSAVTPEQIRERHVDESANWVRKHRQNLRLTRGEAQVVSEIILYHSRKYKLKDCDDRLMCDTEYIRAKLVAAYLRLADAMEVSQSRPEEHEFDRFPLFQDLVSEERDEILFHWVKSFVVAGIAANHTRQVIEIEFQNPKRASAKSGVDSRKFGFLTRYVVNELRDELETVESTLDSGGITSFHDVEYRTVERVDAAGEDGWSKMLPSVINHLQMVYSPNSTGIARAALESLRSIVEDNTEKPRDFQNRLYQLITGLNKQLERRNCHNEVTRIRKRIERAHGHLGDSGDLATVRNALRNYVANFEAMFDSAGGVGKMAEHFWATIEKRCASVSSNGYRFLLFGCSESVAGVLAKRKSELPITLYVAEGRPKTIHGAHNSPIYVDAEAYAARIREQETLENIKAEAGAKIVIIPDACVATAFGRGDDLGPAAGFSAVLFGSNGVYYERADGEAEGTVNESGSEALRSGAMCVAHTVGHLGVAIIAKHFGVPLIVVAASAKIAKKPSRNWSTKDRENKWLTTYSPCVTHLVEDCKATIDWSPREEHVPLSMLSCLVTEKGTIDLDGPAAPLRKKLKQWDADVDVELDAQSAQPTVAA